MSFDLETIVSWAKRRGFAYPGSDIYGGLANAWDLGPYGVEIKRNIENLWRNCFVKDREDMIGLDSQILMNSKVWEASGHLTNFSDPLIDCKKCKARERADKLIEDKIYNETIKVGKEATDYLNEISGKYGLENLIPESWSFEQQKSFIDGEKIKCPKCKSCDWTEPKRFNLMFKTEQGIVEGQGAEVYLRPETAQGIFVNFKNILDTTRSRIPFGVAQVGKAFRNEITPGNFMFRVREFYQMEIEYFVENNEEVGLKALNDWKETCENWWREVIGIKGDKLRFREHDKDELSFYSKGTWDVEYLFPWGWGELQGIAYRTDYDLRQHMKHANKDMQYSDPKTGKRFVPHVIEPSWGLTRAILTVMIDSYDEETYQDGNGNDQTRVVARFHKNVAPIKFAILPLVEKSEEMIELSRKIYKTLSKDHMCEFDVGGNIGKRYRRQDEIGTPYCITVDYQSLEDGTVTVRDRDTMKQERVKIENIKF